MLIKKKVDLALFADNQDQTPIKKSHRSIISIGILKKELYSYMICVRVVHV